MKKTLTVIIAILLCTTMMTMHADAQQPKTATVVLNELSNGRTVSLIKGQKLTITLLSPTEGYSVDLPHYNASILHLDSISHVNLNTNPFPSDPGNDVWSFSVIRSGASIINITMTQYFPKRNIQLIFSGIIVVTNL